MTLHSALVGVQTINLLGIVYLSMLLIREKRIASLIWPPCRKCGARHDPAIDCL